jgi:3-hydroxyacyl-[acyl-carrier-protein] dehydratase
MTYHQHRFDQIEDYLHHRPPYLLIDSIDRIGDRSIQTSSIVDANAFYIQGHFPGAPVLPGAMMQEMTTQSAGVLIAANYNPMEQYNTHVPDFNEFALGVLVRVKAARYRGFARPGDRLRIEVSLEEIVGSVFEFAARILCGDKTVMQNRFQLTNIPSATLRG